MTAERKNKGRPQLASLVPRGALEAIARAAEVGLVKYKKDSYRERGGYTVMMCLDSCVRHIYAHTGGEKHDEDATKLLGHPVAHLDMAIWNLSAACENLRLYGSGNDDAWSGPAPEDFALVPGSAPVTKLLDEAKIVLEATKETTK